MADQRRGVFMHVKFVLLMTFTCVVHVQCFPKYDLESARVINVTAVQGREGYSELLIRLEGSSILEGLFLTLTPFKEERGAECVTMSNIQPSISWHNGSDWLVSVIVPHTGTRMFVCLGLMVEESMRWIHQGRSIVVNEELDLDGHDSDAQTTTTGQLNWRPRRSTIQANTTVQVLGLRVEASDKHLELADDGVPKLLAGSDAVVRLFGEHIPPTLFVAFTSRNDSCEFLVGEGDYLVELVTDTSALVRLRAPPASAADLTYYLCVKDNSTKGASYQHQGALPWLALRTFDKLLPVWISWVIIFVCLCFSALFSGLNLGLMSLDQTDLKIVANTGSEAERRYAKAIIPVRKCGNYLLCSILLGNVLVNSSLTILMDDLTSGLIAVVGSTVCIVIFGEITPQAICSRHGLAVGAKTIHVTKLVMLVTFPCSWPISKLLDLILGVELGNVYTRERLKELVKITTEYNDLEKDEVNIISGALELRRKTVKEVMTKLEDAFMLNYDSVLDFETVSDIMKQGYSRIPVYENERTNIVTTLFIKDLAFVDPDDGTPLKTLCKFYQNPCNFVFEDTTLDIMFRQFKEGLKGHMAFVHRVNSEGEGDPFYETTGLVTLEDVIEELIQSEIVDETDVWTDNRSKKRRRTEKVSKQDFTIFAERRENQAIHISPQLTLATFQYLSASVDAFKHELISETILRRLLKQDVIHHVKVKNKDRSETSLYSQGKPADYFVLVLEGRVEVTVGREEMRFESGPFTYFGTQALVQVLAGAAESDRVSPAGSLQSLHLEALVRHSFVPDFSVRCLTDVIYIRIRRSLYLAAKRATLMELSKRDEQSQEQFDDEVEKIVSCLSSDFQILPQRVKSLPSFVTRVTLIRRIIDKKLARCLMYPSVLLHSLDEEDPSRANSPSPSNRDHQQLTQNDKRALQRCIAAAERGGGLTAPDASLLHSLSSPGSPPSSPPPPVPHTAPTTPMRPIAASDVCTPDDRTALLAASKTPG